MYRYLSPLVTILGIFNNGNPKNCLIQVRPGRVDLSVYIGLASRPPTVQSTVGEAFTSGTCVQLTWLRHSKMENLQEWLKFSRNPIGKSLEIVKFSRNHRISEMEVQKSSNYSWGIFQHSTFEYRYTIQIYSTHWDSRHR